MAFQDHEDLKSVEHKGSAVVAAPQQQDRGDKTKAFVTGARVAQPGSIVQGVVTKDTNPKDAVGVRKVPLSTVSAPVMLEIGLAMLEGARKYGRHNYRVAGIRYSVYYDAAMRHLMAWWEGEDTDPDSGLSHITKTLATLTVLRDAMLANKTTDDRPPRCGAAWVQTLNQLASDIIDRHPDPKPAFTQVEQP